MLHIHWCGASRPVKKKKKLKRSNPKALQKEDSDAVWNELAYFKTEHKNLFVEK